MLTTIQEYRKYLTILQFRNIDEKSLFLYTKRRNDFNFSYTQGMSDLLAPVLCEIKNESETFWCFVGLMQRAFFVCTPTDNDIDKNLVSE